MRNLDALSNNLLKNQDPTLCSTFQLTPQSMLPGAQSISAELSQATSYQPLSQPTRQPLGVHNPTIIRRLTRRFSPPFKPFGSKDPQTDEESIVSIDSSIIMPSVLASDLASNQFQSHPNSDLIVLSASQPHPIVMIPSSSKTKRSQSRFATLGSDLNELDRPKNLSDEVLHQFALDSDTQMLDASSPKRPRRAGDNSTRQRTVNPFSPNPSVSDLPTPSITSRPLPHARSPKSSPGSTQPSYPHGPTSSDFPKQIKVEDGGISPNAKLSSNELPTAGRAAAARRALFASSDTNNFSWAGLQKPSEPLPGSSKSPRLRFTRRLSPNSLAAPALLPGSGSSASDEDPRVPALGSPDEVTVANKPTKKPKTKSAATTSHPKRPKQPLSPICVSSAPEAPVTLSQNDKNDSQVKRRITTLLPATEPDESGQYESSTCHQCRVKTTRPKMICDQSQDSNCVVRVCHTCLMIRTVYDDMPELRPPKFQFVPGGTMLCVKCRDICPCASCRRRRGEKEHSRRGLGSNLKGFYGLTPEEREQALARKKEKQDAARLKKESRPPVEKKAPSTFRREVTSIRSAYDDDEHERLQHWAPLPVFPPLPKRRKKKRKRLEIMEGARLDSQASDTSSDSSCSDSDTYEETDSDFRSLSSESSCRSNARAHVVLGPVSFQLPLSSNTRNTVPLLTKRWRSNFSRSIKGDKPNFSKRAYHAASCTSQGDKAPVVWIKSGAMVQARKPPTTEFMQRLAEEQKGRSNSDSNVADNPDVTMSPLAIDEENLSLNPLDPPHSASQDKMTIPKSNSSISNVPSNLNSGDTNLHSLKPSSKYSLPLTRMDDNHPHEQCTCALEQLEPSIQPLGNPLTSHSEKCALFRSSSYSKSMPLNDDLGMSPDTLNATSSSLMAAVGLTDHQAEFGMQIEGIKAFQAMSDNVESLSSLSAVDRHQFDQSGPSEVDHQTYLAGLTDEQLTAVLKEGHYVMAKQGFLPSSITPDGLPIKFNHGGDELAHHRFSAGISPELISASLPLAMSKEDVTAAEGQHEGERSARLTTELTEEDQEDRLIEAANWAAVWGATDGAGGFMITKSSSLDKKQQEGPKNVECRGQSNQDVRDLHQSTTMPSVNGPPIENSDSRSGTDLGWVNHACGADKELFLRAMKSRVGDEWLTDVMPLDSC